MSHILEIDGSVLEGGGQILRMSIAFSAILGKPVRVNRIRASRSKPGLAAQHLSGIRLVAEMCQAKTKGLEIGSTEIEFAPGKILGGHYLADCVTAGSISLLLQVALPCALLADSQVTMELKGGTNADMAPQVDYMTEVFRPILEKLGGSFDFDLIRRGYFPKGGGHVTVTVNPVEGFNSIQLTEQGKVDKIFGWSFVAGTLPIKMANEMHDGAKEELSQLCRNVQIECYKEAPDIAPNNCSGIILVSETSTGCVLGADALGARGAAARGLGRGAGSRLAADVTCGACVDTHAQDQVIIYMALAAGASAVRVGDVTMHTQTAMHVANLFSGVKFNVVPCGKTNIIECTGLGYSVRKPV